MAGVAVQLGGIHRERHEPVRGDEIDVADRLELHLAGTGMRTLGKRRDGMIGLRARRVPQQAKRIGQGLTPLNEPVFGHPLGPWSPSGVSAAGARRCNG
jgi:hypothetical protein